MGNAVQAIRTYVRELLAMTRRAAPPVAAHLRDLDFAPLPEARFLFERLHRTLEMHADELASHLRRLGGTDAPLSGEAAVARNTEVAGLGQALRDEYASVTLLHAGALMLEANARALNFSSSAALAGRHRDELNSLLARIEDLTPVVVKGEVESEPAHRATA